MAKSQNPWSQVPHSRTMPVLTPRVEAAGVTVDGGLTWKSA